MRKSYKITITPHKLQETARRLPKTKKFIVLWYYSILMTQAAFN